MVLNAAPLQENLTARAQALGWAAIGFTTVQPFHAARERLLDALQSGRLDGMPWLNERRVRQATEIEKRFPWARSIISLAWPYAPITSAVPVFPSEHGAVASYACLASPETGRAVDYHELLQEQCSKLVDSLATDFPDMKVKSFIDHGWAVDRAIAERAGIGFIGKNACLITQEAGSFVLLAAIVCSIPFAPTQPLKRTCGSCTSCIDACPTGAISKAFVIDSRKCISYWTIEHKGKIPEKLRPQMGAWVFGCDICQNVCPINERKAPPLAQTGTSHPGPVPYPNLIATLLLDEDTFQTLYRATPLERTGWESLVRNAAIALGNVGTNTALPALSERLQTTDNPVISDAATWAIDQITLRSTELCPPLVH